MDPSQKRKISLKDLVSTLIVLGLFVGIFYMGHYASSQITTLNAKNKSLSQQYEDMKNELQTLKGLNAQLLQEKSELVAQIAAVTKNQKEQQLASEGIDAKQVNIKKINLTGSWSVSDFNYQLVSAYLSPTISDLATYMKDDNLKDMHFLMIEIDISDSRKSGGEIGVPVNDYMKLIDGNLTSEAFTADDVVISAGEQEKVYVGFAVEPLSYQLELRSGYDSNPVINSLDFEGGKTENLTGVFMLKKGFASQYSQ